jgi:hypothetical protein
LPTDSSHLNFLPFFGLDRLNEGVQFEKRIYCKPFKHTVKVIVGAGDAVTPDL